MESWTDFTSVKYEKSFILLFYCEWRFTELVCITVFGRCFAWILARTEFFYFMVLSVFLGKCQGNFSVRSQSLLNTFSFINYSALSAIQPWILTLLCNKSQKRMTVVDLSSDSAKHWICLVCFSITKALLFGLLKCGGLKYMYTSSTKLYFCLYFFPHIFFCKVKAKHVGLIYVRFLFPPTAQ